MNAEFFSITKTEGMSPEEAMAYCARVSSPQNQNNHETAFKLLSYCLKNGHWSVFEMVDLTLKIETSRAIMAQVLRHHSFRFQEFSQRYAAVDSGFEKVEIRAKHVDGNRQGSAEVIHEIEEAVNKFCKATHTVYDAAIKDGAAPESARLILPLCTTTHAYMKGNVRSWITYFWQRLDPHAQKEHRELAELMFIIFEKEFPNIAKIVLSGRVKYVEY